MQKENNIFPKTIIEGHYRIWLIKGHKSPSCGAKDTAALPHVLGTPSEKPSCQNVCQNYTYS